MCYHMNGGGGGEGYEGGPATVPGISKTGCVQNQARGKSADFLAGRHRHARRTLPNMRSLTVVAGW
jgi:hypothetical protein